MIATVVNILVLKGQCVCIAYPREPIQVYYIFNANHKLSKDIHVVIYGNEQMYVKSLSVMLIFAICWLLNIYGGYLGVHHPWWPIAEALAILLFPLTIRSTT